MLLKCALWPASRRFLCLASNHPGYFDFRSRTLSFSRSLCMKAWTINEYGSNDVLELGSVPLPKLRNATDILVRVQAASVNPIDYRMRSGYGQTLLNLRRKLEKVDEFPLILGRDFSGEVVKTGRLARRFKQGDQVWGTPSVIAGGTHAEFVVASQDEISIKPSNWTHHEAASIPYAACTVWIALVSRAGLKPNNCHKKRVLVLGGSGGIGSFAIQLLKAWGAYVASTCSSDAVDLVAGLGADHVVDYTAANMEEELKTSGGFDVVLDPFGGDVGKQYARLLSKWKGAIFVTLAPPVLSNTDKLGASLGLISTGQNLASTAIPEALRSGSLVSWGFFCPNGPALDHIRSLCQSGMFGLCLASKHLAQWNHIKPNPEYLKCLITSNLMPCPWIKPVVQEVFPFSETKEAYSKLESGHARGKIVISMDCNNTTEEGNSVRF